MFTINLFSNQTSFISFQKQDLPIYSTIRWGFPLSRMSTNNEISPMKFCYNTSFSLPKQSQSSISVLSDGSRFLGLFWKEKKIPVLQLNKYIRFLGLNPPSILQLYYTRIYFGFAFHMLCPRYSRHLTPTASTTNRL